MVTRAMFSSNCYGGSFSSAQVLKAMSRILVLHISLNVGDLSVIDTLNFRQELIRLPDRIGNLINLIEKSDCLY